MTPPPPLWDADVEGLPLPHRHRGAEQHNQNENLCSDSAMGAFPCDNRRTQRLVHGGLDQGAVRKLTYIMSNTSAEYFVQISPASPTLPPAPCPPPPPPPSFSARLTVRRVRCPNAVRTYERPPDPPFLVHLPAALVCITPASPPPPPPLSWPETESSTSQVWDSSMSRDERGQMGPEGTPSATPSFHYGGRQSSFRGDTFGYCHSPHEMGGTGKGASGVRVGCVRRSCRTAVCGIARCGMAGPQLGHARNVVRSADMYFRVHVHLRLLRRESATRGWVVRPTIGLGVNGGGLEKKCEGRGPAPGGKIAPFRTVQERCKKPSGQCRDSAEMGQSA